MAGLIQVGAKGRSSSAAPAFAAEIMRETNAISASGKVIANAATGQGILVPNNTARRTVHLWLGNLEDAAFEGCGNRRIAGNATHAWAIHDAFARAPAISVEADFARRHATDFWNAIVIVSAL
jgi:hypothetical protein